MSTISIVETEAFQALTIPELYALAKEAEERAAQLKEQNAIELRERFDELAKAQGLNLSDIFGHVPTAKGKAKAKAKSKAKYQNPNNPIEQWSGRGRKPSWVMDHLKNGGKVETLAIS